MTGYMVRRPGERGGQMTGESAEEVALRYGKQLGYAGPVEQVGPKKYTVAGRPFFSDPLVLEVWAPESTGPEARARMALLTHLAGSGVFGVAAAEFPLFTAKPTKHRAGGFWYDQTGRADLAVFRGDHVAGYEIKTATDSLTRLPKQWPEYVEGFSYCSFVLAPNHMKKARELLPERAGLLLLEKDHVTPVRAARRNPKPHIMRYLLGLWRVELEGIASGYLPWQKTRIRRADMYSLAFAVAQAQPYEVLLQEVRCKRLARSAGKREAWQLPSLG